MGRPAGWMRQLTGRDTMRSPGAPSHRREIERQFWVQIATGITSEKAAEAAGVSQAVGSRWFRHRGGMPLFMSKPISNKYLSFAEREEIGLLRAQDLGMREIARRIGRSPSTISRELTRNAATRGGKLEYRASVAQWKSDLLARRPKPAKLVMNPRLRDYVQERLEGSIHDARGREVSGPRQAPFIGRNKPHRGDRKWVNGWSPEQITNRLRVDFPDDPSMRISHEAIYQALYIQGRGALKRELVSYLRTGRALRTPRARSQAKAWAHVSEEVMISSRPAEIEDRAVPGHWGGRLDHRSGQVGYWNAGRTVKSLHHARAPTAGGRLWTDSSDEERPPARRIRSCHHGQCPQENGDEATYSTVAIIDLGSWQRAVGPLPVHHRVWGEGLLCRPSQSMAAWHERKHERAAAPVFPQGNRSVSVE